MDVVERGHEGTKVAGTLYLGTSGFAYDEWKGSFYPSRLSRRDMLRFYAGRFNCVEINYTFRRRPSEETLVAWRDATPEGFSFALKAHQFITHGLRFSTAEDAVADFIRRARTLGPRLGPILFQCPPSFQYEPAMLERFLDRLPPGHRYAFEFRHPSWADAKETIASRGAAWCVAETDDPPPVSAIGAGPFAYLRLRKMRYDDAALSRWAGRIAGGLRAGLDVYCFFKHEERGLGPVLAERLARLIATRLPKPPSSCASPALSSRPLPSS